MISSVRRLFAKRPLIANCLTYGSLYAGAEFTQQTILRKVLAEEKEEYDPALVSRYFILGSTVLPTFLYGWYKILDARLPGTAIRTVALKVVIDQAVSAPVAIGIFYTGMSLMEGKEDIFEELKSKFWNTYKTSCMFWMPAQALNFLFLPPAMRVVYIGTCSFLWVNILCVLKRAAGGEENKED